jgi:hypothetical protein
MAEETLIRAGRLKTCWTNSPAKPPALPERIEEVRRISPGCRLMTSNIGVRSIRFSATNLEKIGVSMIPKRIHNPMATRIKLRKNGTRHPSEELITRHWTEGQNDKIGEEKPTGDPELPPGRD